MMKIFNTLGRKKEELKPLKKGNTIRFYACGPTVYNYAHLGNLRSYVFMDLLRKTLEYEGYEVELVVNITDVGHLTDDADQGEDKMEKSARKQNKTVWDIANHYTKEFKKDVKALNIKEPNHWPKATDHIEEQIALVEAMEENGYTYKTSDGIYFDTSKLDDYGKLVPNFNPADLDAGSRVDMKEKRNKTDFALWKFSGEEEQRQMEWESPWGTGFPGWHIECTAMACKYLGDTFELHTGGIDHIPVHHTNEIAQAQGAFGHDHVKYWMHSEFLKVDSGKMSKSKGNFLRLQTLKDKGYHSLDYRYFLLQAHYRKPQNFSWEALNAAKSARRKLMRKVSLIASSEEIQEETQHKQKFENAISDDLNIPKALSVLHDVLDSDLESGIKLEHVKKFDFVLGIGLRNIQTIKVPREVRKLASKREKLREQKRFLEADELRAQIFELGFIVKDDKDGGFKIERKETA